MEHLCELKIRAVSRTAKVLLIFLWQITVPFIQSSEVSTNSDNNLLPELLQLQRDYCGEVILCDDDRHVEPDFGMLVMPCCVPCSCLPICRALDICCPNFNNSTVAADEHRNETRIQILKDAIVTDKLLHPDDSQSRQNEVQIESNTTREVAETSKERLICVRPQIQREQNVYLDSLAYRMIGKCPAEQSDTTVDKQCQKGFSNVGFNNIVPVTSYASNMTYVNIHCLKCNENTSLEIKIKYWNPIITIESWGYTHHFFTDPQDIVSYLLKYEYFNGMKTGNIHFVPPNPELLQPCQQYDVTSCNKTGLWDVYNKTTEQLCLSGYSMPVIRRPSATGTTLSFRNMACLYCNQPNESFGKLVIRKGSICLKRKTIFGPTPRFNMTLNVPNLNSSTNQEDKSTLISKQYIDATVALTLIKQTKACQNGYIAILDSCRKILCPRDHYNKDGYCIPLYNTLSGISLQVKFEIIPSQRIAPADRLEFAKTLNYLANSTLKQTTSLHNLHLSVWYLPRSRTNPGEFYLLNMYLSSRSGVIKYDRSMKEIQNFYNSLKTNSKLRHKNGSDVTLQLKFGNRVDFVGKKATSYVLGGVSLSHLFTAGRSINGAEPGMIISESNWCYRTAIMRNETEFVAKNVLIIKEANIQLNRDQFERNGLEYYVCLELFQAGIEETKSLSKKRPTITNDSTGTADIEDETPWFSNQTTVIAIVMFALVLLTFAFCKIKAKKFKTKLRFFQGAEKADDINKRESFELHHLDMPM